MDKLTFEKNYKHGKDFYYGKKKVIIKEYYEFFGFVDVVEEENTLVFALPISVLSLERDLKNYIYLDRINDLSKY